MLSSSHLIYAGHHNGCSEFLERCVSKLDGIFEAQVEQVGSFESDSTCVQEDISDPSLQEAKVKAANESDTNDGDGGGVAILETTAGELEGDESCGYACHGGCLLNETAIAIRHAQAWGDGLSSSGCTNKREQKSKERPKKRQKERRRSLLRVAVLDLDVHFGVQHKCFFSSFFYHCYWRCFQLFTL